ncbi:SLBB domain-containing protein [Curvibacter gracilis]|uniref:SLBB domain-containing protein n=1 Tax=Curvibacter gracilis TaxID=230310 RepID=UPI0004B14CD2|nr:SLBB domain-containing protein [Curvibacter gracilis]
MNVPIRRLLRNMRWPVCLAWLACQALAFATPMVSNLPFDMGWNGADAQVQAVPGKAPAPLSPARSPAPVSAAKSAPPKANAPAAADSSPATGVLSVGPGDLLQVTVFGQPDMSAEVSVTDGGEVTLPLIGLIRIAGMAPSEVEKVIAQRLRERQYLLQPEVSVTVRQNRSQAVSVLGEVVRPGRYPIQGRFTVLDLLAVAGGLTPKADTVVVLLRKGEGGSAAPAVRIPIRLDRVASPDRSPLDMPLNHDDMVYVGQQKFFYIHGEVRRPGSYPMEPDLDVMRALSISGGVTERGSMGRINIHRKSEGTGAQDFSPRLTDPILDGDVIYVKERIF